MVQLEAFIHIRNTSDYSKFQFLYGTIRGLSTLFKLSKVRLFQFLYGTIRGRYFNGKKG